MSETSSSPPSALVDTMMIAGASVRGTGPALPVFSPRSGATIAEIPEAEPAQLDRAVASARRAFEHWGIARTPAERSQLLLAVADALESRMDELADLECLDTGKDRETFLADETHTIVDPFRFYAGVCRSLPGVSAGEYVAGHTSFVRRDPVGVVGLIAPWNYPLMSAVWKLAPSLAAGNCAVLKPAEDTPLATLRMAEILAQVLPPDVVHVVHGRGETVGRALVAHPGIDMVSLTGAISTGQAVMRDAAARVKRVHLELGGNAPVIVFPDADLDHAATTIAQAGLYNAGQDCTAACRIYAHERVYEDMLEKLAAAMDAVDQRQPLISAVHLERVSGFVERARSLDHARLLRGPDPDAGELRSEGGYFHPTTLLADMRQEDEVVRHEVFGPVITVTPFAHRAQVLDMANDTEYGLSASLFTRDLDTAMAVSRRLRYGSVWVNDHLVWPTEMPHGGVKMSGHGKEMSVYSIEDYTEIRHIMMRFEEG